MKRPLSELDPVPGNSNPAEERGEPALLSALAPSAGRLDRFLVEKLHDLAVQLTSGAPAFGGDELLERREIDARLEPDGKLELGPDRRETLDARGSFDLQIVVAVRGKTLRVHSERG